MLKFEDIVGTKIGLLSIGGFFQEERNGKKRTFYNCVCDCGETLVRERAGLVSSKSKVKSCGCYKKASLSKIRFKHGLTDTRIHRIWQQMRSRINRKSHKKYKHYGGRGIRYAPEWDVFENFYRDMNESYLVHLEKYGEKDTTLDRIDPDGDYTKENCKWSTIEEQNNNKRISYKRFKATNIKTGEETIETSRVAFAKKVGISDKHIGSVLNGNRKSSQGFTFEYID
jgi:hypothetical protein